LVSGSGNEGAVADGSAGAAGEDGVAGAAGAGVAGDVTGGDVTEVSADFCFESGAAGSATGVAVCAKAIFALPIPVKSAAPEINAALRTSLIFADFMQRSPDKFEIGP